MDTLVSLKGVDFAYTSGNKVLSGINININKGDLVGLIGPIGAGKTTLLRIMAGVYKTHIGKVMRNKSSISYLPSSRGLVEMLTVKENLNIWRCAYNVKKTYMSEVIEKLKLKTILDKKVLCLSSGMKQKVAIAVSFLMQQGFYLLDEPFVNLDFDTCELICDMLKKNLSMGNNGFIVSSHNLEYLEQICNRLIFLNKGRIVKTVDEYSSSSFEQIKQLYIESIKG